MNYKDPEMDSEYKPLLSLLDNHDEVFQVNFTDFAHEKKARRGVPVKMIETENGKQPMV